MISDINLNIIQFICIYLISIIIIIFNPFHSRKKYVAQVQIILLQVNAQTHN